MFTAGGNDLSVHMWSIDITPIEEAVLSGGEGIQPFIEMIDGGREGTFWQEMKEYFHYAQIKR